MSDKFRQEVASCKGEEAQNYELSIYTTTTKKCFKALGWGGWVDFFVKKDKNKSKQKKPTTTRKKKITNYCLLTGSSFRI